jgi:hypothetical protein
MLQRKEHFAATPLSGPQPFYAPLQRSYLPVTELAGLLRCNASNRFPRQARIRIRLLSDPVPDPLQRIPARAPAPLRAYFHWGASRWPGTIRAVFTSMTALPAANSCGFSIFDNLFNLLICASVIIAIAPSGDL